MKLTTLTLALQSRSAFTGLPSLAKATEINYLTNGEFLCSESACPNFF